MATAFPAEWGRLGREGTVVRLESEHATWVVNLQPGLGGIDLVKVHPNMHDAVVVAAGDLWVVDPVERSAHRLLPAIDAVFDVNDPAGWVFSRQGIALARFGPEGIIWHTRRLSWDGFDKLAIEHDQVTGLGWSPIDEQWHPFWVDLRSGRSEGGSYDGPDEGWEERSNSTLPG